MAARIARPTVWLAWIGSMTALILAIVLWASQRFALPPVRFVESPLVIVGEMLFAFACITVGLVLGTKRAENPIGWVFMALGASLVGVLLVNSLVAAGHQVMRPLDQVVLLLAWFFNSFQLPASGLLAVLLFLWFPDGHCLTRRWNWVAVTGAVGVALISFAVAFNPVGLIWYPSLANPFRLPSSMDGIIFAAAAVGLVVFLVSLALSTGSIVVRYRGADQVRRLQLKWIALAAVILAVSATPFLVVRYAMDVPDVVGTAALALMILAAPLVPIAATVAILRYHLLDIDVLINKAVTYIALSGILSGIYTATILLFQRIFIAVTGDRSDAAIILATLVLASVFTPVRKALEGFVDRHVKPTTAEAPAANARAGVPGWDFNRGEPMPGAPTPARSQTLGEPIAAPSRPAAAPVPAPAPVVAPQALTAAASLGAAAADDAPATPASDDAARIAELEARLRVLEQHVRGDD